MRKPRDFDSELKALADKAKQLKERRVRDIGELVMATGADALDVNILAGVLLHAVQTKDRGMKETWQKSGAAFFQAKTRKASPATDAVAQRGLPFSGGDASA